MNEKELIRRALMGDKEAQEECFVEMRHNWFSRKGYTQSFVRTEPVSQATFALSTEN